MYKVLHARHLASSTQVSLVSILIRRLWEDALKGR